MYPTKAITSNNIITSTPPKLNNNKLCAIV